MKKIIILLLTICLLFIAVSCQTNPSNQETSNPDLEESTAELPGFGIRNYEEYEIFINTTELPNAFIPYKALDTIGTFNYWTILSSFWSGNYNTYLYDFIDANNYRIGLTINHLGNSVEWDLLPMPENMTDLRTYPEAISGKVVVGDISYIFFRGDLQYIKWRCNDIAFTLHMTDNISYPTDGKETFLSKMLSLETAEETMESLLSDIAAYYEAQVPARKISVSSYKQLLELQTLTHQTEAELQIYVNEHQETSKGMTSGKDVAQFLTVLDKVAIPDLGRFADLIDVTYNMDEQYIRFTYTETAGSAIIRFTLYLTEEASAAMPMKESYMPWKTISIGQQKIDLCAHVTDLEEYEKIHSVYGHFSTEYGEVLVNIDAGGMEWVIEGLSEYLQFVPFSELPARE